MEVEVTMVGTGRQSQRILAGADTWACRNLIHVDLFKRLGGNINGLQRGVPLTAVGGHSITCHGVGQVEVNGTLIEVYVLPHMGVPSELILGDPALRALSRGQLRIDYSGKNAEAFIAAVGADIIDTDCIIRRKESSEKNDTSALPR
jgi:hypothetical protein